MRLGKQPPKDDPKTMRLGSMLTVPKVPLVFDFDKGRAPLPMEAWGNFKWGDCVEVGKYLGLVRLERIETKKTLVVTEAEVVNYYKSECFKANGVLPDKPGDPGDTGLVVLDSLKDWRNSGLPVGYRRFKLAAYGLLNHHDQGELMAACYGLHGVYFGLNLPMTAQEQIRAKQRWDVESGPDSKPGTWGGHLVYCKRYNRDGMVCITWGQEQLMTWNFIGTYADEVWGVVDDFDSAKRSKSIDVNRTIEYLRSIGASNIG